MNPYSACLTSLNDTFVTLFVVSVSITASFMEAKNKTVSRPNFPLILSEPPPPSMMSSESVPAIVFPSALKTIGVWEFVFRFIMSFVRFKISIL